MQNLRVGDAALCGARVQVEHQVARCVVELLGVDHGVCRHDLTAYFEGTVVTSRHQAELHEQKSACTLRDGTHVVVVGNPLVSELHVVVALLGDRETVIRREVVLGGLYLVVDPRYVAELVDHLVVTVGAVEITLAYHFVLLGLTLEGGVGAAVKGRIGILYTLESLRPVPAHLVAVDRSGQTRRGHLRDEVAHRTRCVGLAVDGDVRGEHLGENGGAVTEKLVTHVTLRCHKRGLEAFRVDVCVLRSEE